MRLFKTHTKPYKQNRPNVGRIALERLMGALINCNLPQSGRGGGLNWTKKTNSGLQITTLEIKSEKAPVSAHFSFDFLY